MADLSCLASLAFLLNGRRHSDGGQSAPEQRLSARPASNCDWKREGRRGSWGWWGGGGDKKEGSTPTVLLPSVSSRRPKCIFLGGMKSLRRGISGRPQFTDLVSPRSPPWKRARLPPCSGDGSRFITLDDGACRVRPTISLLRLWEFLFFSSSPSRRCRAARCGALATLSVWFASSARRSAGNVNAIIKITK